MKQAAQQLLKNPDIEPSDEIIADGLGAANITFVQFIKNLNDYDVFLMDWRYYNDGKAWLSKGEYRWKTSRGTDKVKPIFWLSIWDGFFKVSFFFSEKLRNNLLSLPVSNSTKDLVKSAKPHGKSMKYLSITFDVSSKKQLKDIYLLVQLRKEKI